MFENQNPQFNNQGRSSEGRAKRSDSGVLPKTEPEDIFAETEKRGAGIIGAPSGPTIPALSKRRNWIMLVAVVLIIALVAVAGWWIYGSLKLNVKSEKLEEGKEKIEKEIKNPAAVEPPVMEVDTDGDGLSDEEEGKLGTDASKPDTDEDGLFDREEVKAWQTDPLNPDTDNDGFQDGEEVKGGYNPKGEGRWKENPSL